MKQPSPRRLLPAFILGFLLFHLRPRPPPVTKVPGLKCVRVLLHRQTREGFGAMFKLNKLAALLASYYETKLHFASIDSVHDYNFHSFFSTCGPEEDKAFPENCAFNSTGFWYRMCRPGDCTCIGEQFRSTMEGFAKKGCSTVGVRNDGYKRYEFSGCLSVLPRYFAATGRPKWSYDAIHYRQGDLAGNQGRGKAFTKEQMQAFVDELCRLSDRDIVVVTEGRPTIPTCGNRVVLAGDTSIQHAMNIFQFAHTVVIGVSSFAHVLMEFAQPQRVVVANTAARRFEYVNCERWSIIDVHDGGVHRFDTKREMLRVLSSTRDLRSVKGKGPIVMGELKVPERLWSKEMMRPARLYAE